MLSSEEGVNPVPDPTGAVRRHPSPVDEDVAAGCEADRARVEPVPGQELRDRVGTCHFAALAATGSLGWSGEIMR